MNLKKFASVFLSCIVAGTLFTGCGDSTPAQNSEQESIKVGRIKALNASENLYDEIVKKVEKKSNVQIYNYQTIFYDNLSMMQMGLESNSVQEASTYKCVADYLVARNPSFEIVEKNVPLKFVDNFTFAMRVGDTELKNAVDSAVESMRNEGVLDALTKTYITDLKNDEEPPAVAFENFEGADIIEVGVTGDLPPLDLILPDGTPAGFNTAIISELGKRLQKNIKIVQIESASRASALTSGQIDISFWAIVPTNEDVPSDVDKPQGVELSAPYFADEIVHIVYKQ